MSSDNTYSILKASKVFFDIRRVVDTFECYRKRKDGSEQKVRVEIHDSEKDPNRYTCIAISEDGKVASGNPASTIQTAIAFVHWHKLD